MMCLTLLILLIILKVKQQIILLEHMVDECVCYLLCVIISIAAVTASTKAAQNWGSRGDKNKNSNQYQGKDGTTKTWWKIISLL